MSGVLASRYGYHSSSFLFITLLSLGLTFLYDYLTFINVYFIFLHLLYNLYALVLDNYS